MAEQGRPLYRVVRAGHQVGTCLLFGLTDEFIGEAKADVGVWTDSDGWTEHGRVVKAATNAAHIHIGVEGEQLVVWHVSRALRHSPTTSSTAQLWRGL